MANNCNDEQIKRDGTGQVNRFLPALDPVNAPLDDRKPEDILVFAKHYADLVRFYDAEEVVDWANLAGIESKDMQASNDDSNKTETKNVYTWKEFFYKDIAVVVASIMQYKNKLGLLKQEYDDKRKETNDKPTTENYRELFTTILHHLKRINRWCERSIDDHPLKNELEIKIKSTLAPSLQ